jgi:hypothetical protein
MICPFCRNDNHEEALVCAACASDIAIPQVLIEERDDLIRKRDTMRDKLSYARRELDRLLGQMKW